MDGDAGGMDGDAPASMSGVGVGSRNGDSSVGTESTDDDSGSSVLQSMGYIDGGAGIDRGEGDSTGSVTSLLQPVIIIAVVGFFGLSFLFFLLKGVLAVFGVQL